MKPVNVEKQFVHVPCTPSWPRGYKTIFMLNSAGHKRSTSDKAYIFTS